MTKMLHEKAVVFDCEGERLIGVVTQPVAAAETGVVIVVGGPQYRAGSHRQFTLLARHLAENGIPSIRFDYRGMGDSEGEMRNFEHIDADIHAAIDTLCAHVPAVSKIALWGLCDAASAAMYYGGADERVSDLILLNPWIHTPAGAARARLKHYYLTRLFQKSFWAKVLSGRFRFGGAVRDLAKSAGSASSTAEDSPSDPRHGSLGYVARMLRGLQQFRGRAHVLLSGNDLTAQEFRALAEHDKQWKKQLRHGCVRQHVIKDANHTFSRHEWRKQVESLTTSWLKEPTRS